jgi:hypothetical protein
MYSGYSGRKAEGRRKKEEKHHQVETETTVSDAC